METFIKIALGIFLAANLTACQKIAEAYLGFPLQPKNINAEFEPGLNIFGMIKAGPTMDTINHFFEVQQILSVFDDAETMTINNASIELTRHRSGVPTREYVLFSISSGRYSSSSIAVNGGDFWEYECIYDTFLITAHTQVPQQPTLEEGSITFSENKLAFSINTDSTAFIYDIYYINSEIFVNKRIIPQHHQPTLVELNIPNEPIEQQGLLFVIAYDANYEKYISVSNTFFKPNAFRPQFSTVDGGYGCFGSAHILQVTL